MVSRPSVVASLAVLLSSRPAPLTLLRPDTRPPFVQPARRPRTKGPYTVERRPSTNGKVVLVGYDGHGDVMVESHMPARTATIETMIRIRQWVRDQDWGPPASDRV